MKKLLLYIIFILGILGISDALYLTYEHFGGQLPPCTVGVFSDCGKVLKSSYATPLGIPLAIVGVVHYLLVLVWTILAITKEGKSKKILLVAQSIVGMGASIYFVFLQLVVIKALCLYCMVSATVSTLIFVLTLLAVFNEFRLLCIYIISFLYKNILKRIFFCLDPERVHVFMVSVGETLGPLPLVKQATSMIFNFKSSSLEQTVAGIKFSSPVGLAAGFDYEARLTQSLSSWGFGFQTIGTITNKSYEGNPRPMLGRLPKSRSLMVNKGFKNLGALATINKLRGKNLAIPLGVSIGRSNSKKLTSQSESITDILNSFKLFEKSNLKHSYYELNISCPNLYGNVTFYPPRNLEALLKKIDSLKIKKPIFIKMPIEKSNKEFLEMLRVIVKHNIAGIIIGNLQKDRNNPALNKEEVAKFKVGNFSGKPTFKRSNELISLTYKHYKKRLIIIGCGGVFNSEDAYEKIRRGATLVQLITGLIFEGPQMVSQINMELAEMLKNKNYKNINQAVGSAR